MHKFDQYLFLATSAPIGLLIGHASLAEPQVLPQSSHEWATAEDWLAYVLQREDSPFDAATWREYELDCQADGGVWNHALHCCAMPRPPRTPARDIDQDGEPIATK
jgi:hypothetical protein